MKTCVFNKNLQTYEFPALARAVKQIGAEGVDPTVRAVGLFSIPMPWLSVSTRDTPAWMGWPMPGRSDRFPFMANLAIYQ